MQQERSADFASWEFTFAGDNDVLITTETHQGKEQTRGTILLVSGQAMLTKGLSLERGYEIDALDTPVLMYQLVVSLLSQAAPEGPEKLEASRKVHLAEPKRGIQIATQSASGRFPPPWTLSGSINKAGPRSFDYSLVFTYPADDSGKKTTIALSGVWKKDPTPPALQDGMSIEGWSLHTIGPFSLKQEHSTILDYGAQKRPLEVRTLGELRRALAKDATSPVE